MYYLCLAVTAAIVTVFYPWIRWFFKRIACAVKIKRMCGKKNFILHTVAPFWFFGGNDSEKCDLYIETESTVFAVKLFGMTRRLCVMIFREAGGYFIRRYLAALTYGGTFRSPVESEPTRLPDYDFRFGYKDEWNTKTPRRILLVNPIPMEFRYQTHTGNERIVWAGEVMEGMEIDSLTRLLYELENVE